MTKTFIRKDTNKKKRIESKWRKPKGITNKKRLNRKGHSINVRTGYKKPENQKNKINGLEMITITNITQLQNINPKTQGILISKLGKAKKTQIQYVRED